MYALNIFGIFVNLSKEAVRKPEIPLHVFIEILRIPTLPLLVI